MRPAPVASGCRLAAVPAQARRINGAASVETGGEAPASGSSTGRRPVTVAEVVEAAYPGVVAGGAEPSCDAALETSCGGDARHGQNEAAAAMGGRALPVEQEGGR